MSSGGITIISRKNKKNKEPSEKPLPEVHVLDASNNSDFDVDENTGGGISDYKSSIKMSDSKQKPLKLDP